MSCVCSGFAFHSILSVVALPHIVLHYTLAQLLASTQRIFYTSGLVSRVRGRDWSRKIKQKAYALSFGQVQPTKMRSIWCSDEDSVNQDCDRTGLSHYVIYLSDFQLRLRSSVFWTNSRAIWQSAAGMFSQVTTKQVLMLFVFRSHLYSTMQQYRWLPLLIIQMLPWYNFPFWNTNVPHQSTCSGRNCYCS